MVPESAVSRDEGRPARRGPLARRPSGGPAHDVVWVVVARPVSESGEEASSVVAVFSELPPALDWMAESAISLLLVPMVVDAELRRDRP